VADAGLNPYLFEMVNIREQCSWVHQSEKEKATEKANREQCSWVHQNQKEEATEKAKDLVRSGVARARFLEPQTELEVPITKTALVIGGGVSGIQAALDLADGGHQVYLVEKEPTIGGIMAALDKTYPTMDCSI